MQIWSFASEHKAQSILVLLQMITVIVGMCFIRAIGKLIYEDPDWRRSTAANNTTELLYNGGFLLMLVPPAWVAITLYFEKKHEGRYPRWMTFASGMALLAYLMWLFYWHNMCLLTPAN